MKFFLFSPFKGHGPRRINPGMVTAGGVLGCLAIALVLRITQLDAKPPWTDEFATWVFSVGRTFEAIPLGQWLTPGELLQVLHPLPQADVSQVIHGLWHHDNHPPFYFLLAHYWYRLFPSSGPLAVAVVRSLPVVFGVLAVPLGYGIGCWLEGRRRSAWGLWIALLMALSPYGLFLSQEARHYTLAILWGLLSLACCLKAAHHLQRGQPMPWGLTLAWIGVNGLGIATHFFIGLLLAAQAIALGVWGWEEKRRGLSINVWRLLPAVLGTLAVIGVWAWALAQREFGHGMTDWIQFEEMTWLSIVIGPLAQLLAAWITMVCLLPVESPSLTIVILSGLGMVVYFAWLWPLVHQGWHRSLTQETGLFSRLLVYIFGSLALLYLAITYGMGMDITRGARYSFNFWPVLMLLLAIALAHGGESAVNHSPRPWLAQTYQWPRYPLIIILVGLLSGLTIVGNLGYQKYYRPDQFLTLLAQTDPTADHRIVSPHQTLVQTGEVLGLALEGDRHFPQLSLQFALLPTRHRRDPQFLPSLGQLISPETNPFHLWVVNYDGPLALPQCKKDPLPPRAINGYPYHHFLCDRQS